MLSVGIFLLCVAAMGKAWWLFSKARKTRSKAVTATLRTRGTLFLVLAVLLAVIALLQIIRQPPTPAPGIRWADITEVPAEDAAHIIPFPEDTSDDLPVLSLASTGQTTIVVPAKNVASVLQDNALLDVQIKDTSGEDVFDSATLQRTQEGTLQISLEQRAFHPGKYTLEVRSLAQNSPASTSRVLFTQDFLWGVLAFNTDIDAYAPGETAHISLGVLDDAGRTLCTADVRIESTAPSGRVSVLRTTDGSIRKNPDCKDKSVTNIPDYAVNVALQEQGTYLFRVTADTINGRRTMEESIVVTDNPFPRAERQTATRIYPLAAYTVQMRFTSDRNFTGVIRERVPLSFVITDTTPQATVTEDPANGEKILSWEGTWQRGASSLFSYTYDAPDISPEFYLLGPLNAETTGGETIFTERRQWQIASDATGLRILGTAYTDRGITPLTSKTVAVSLNGGAAAASTTTTSTGAFVLNGLTMTGGTIVTLYLDNETEKAVTVTLGSGDSMQGIDLYQNYLIARSDSGSTALTNQLLRLARANNDTDLSAIYHVSPSNVLTMTGKSLHVWTGDTFRPGGKITTSNASILGTLDLESNTIIAKGSWDSANGTVSYASNATKIVLAGTGSQSITAGSALPSVMIGTGATSLGSEETPLQQILDLGYDSGPLVGDYNMGYRFTANANGYITQLGRKCSAGTSTVRLYAYPSGTELASVSVVNGGTSWAYASITPVAVTAGSQYMVAERNSSYCRNTNFSNPSTIGNITISDSRYILSSNAMPTTTSPPIMYGYADIVFRAGAAQGTYTLGSALDINGSLSINTGSILDVSGSNYGLTLSGSFINKRGKAGFVPRAGTVTLDGASQTLSGSIALYNFRKTVSSPATLSFSNDGVRTISGALTLRGASSNLLSIRSTVDGSAARMFLDGDSGTQTIDYLDVKDSNAVGGASLDCLSSSEGCINSGNNTRWAFAPTFSITGTVYSDAGTTPLTGVTVAASLNGGSANSTAVTEGSGQFSLTGLTMTGGTIVSLYIDNGSQKAATVTFASGSSMAGVNLYQNYLIARSDSGSTALTNQLLRLARANNDTDLSAIYHVSPSNVLTMTGKSLHVWTGDTFRPGGKITTGNASILGTLDLESNTIIAKGSWDSTSGTVSYASNATKIVLAGTGSQSLTAGGGLPSVMMGTGATALGAAETPLQTINPAVSNGPLGGDYNMGYRFTANANGYITQLGNKCSAGTYAARLYAYPAGTELASVSVVNGGTGWAYASITPVAVTAGSEYVVSVRYTSYCRQSSFTYPSTSGNITISDSRYISGSNAMPTSTAPPTMYGFADIVFQANSTSLTQGTYTLGSALDINGSLTINTGSVLDVSGSNYGLTLSGSLTNKRGKSGFVARSGTVTLDGSSQTLSGAIAFYNLSKTVSSPATLSLSNDGVRTISGALTLRGASSNLLSIRSTVNASAARMFLDGDSGTQTIEYLDVKDANASGGAELVCFNCVNSENNTNWTFSEGAGNGAQSISGVVYADPGGTTIGAGKLVAVSLNGGPRKGSGYTLAGGLYKANLTGATMTGGTIVTVYVENETEDAVTVTLGSGSTMTGVNLYQNFLVARSDSGSVALTNTHLNIGAANGDSDISAIYSVSGNNLTLSSGKRMMIRSGNTFTLGGSLAADYLHVDGTFTQGANAITVSQFTQSGGAFTGGSAAMDVNGAFVVEGGTFTQGTNTLNISGNTHIAAAATFTKSSNGSALILDGDLSLSTPGRPDLGNLQIGASPDTTTLESDLVATNVTVGTGDLLITDGYEINASGGFFLHGSLDATSGTDGASTLTLSGAWMMAGGGFTAGASTVLLDGANQRFFGSTSFYNLTKTITTADTLTFPSGYTQAITNALTLQGAAGQLLSLRATTGGQAAGINPSGSRTVQYLDVQDNWNTNVTAISCLSSCTDSGGNTHWFFGEGSGAPPSASNNYLLAPDVQPAGGGEEAKSDLYVLYDTIGEGNIGESTSDSYTLDAGYRQQDAEITISMDCTASVGLGTLTRTGDTSVNTCAQTGYCATNKTTCEVITNNPTGYTLSWAVTTGTGAAGARTGTGYLNGYVAGNRIAPLGTGSTTQSMQPIAMTAGAGTVNNDARWAARLSSTSTTVGGASIDWGSDGLSDTWLRVATGASVNIANRGSAAVGDTQNIGFRAMIHGTAIVPSDTYKATVTITAITN